MKGGQSSRYWGRPSSFTVAALLFTTLFLWSWENNPLLTSLLSAQEQFLIHAPVCGVCIGFCYYMVYLSMLKGDGL